MSKTLSKKGVGLCVSFLLALFLASGCTGDGNGLLPAQRNDIVDTAVSTPYLQTFAEAVEAARLSGTLKGIGPYTVFAPSNEAFAKVPGGTARLLEPVNRTELAGILRHHIVAQAIYTDNAAKLQEAIALDGAVLRLAMGATLGDWQRGGGRYYGRKNVPSRVKHEYLTVDHAAVIRPDIMCSNGVIHVIDKVLMP